MGISITGAVKIPQGKVTVGSAAAPVPIGKSLWAWGDNSPYGHLGLGDVIDRSSPVQVGGVNDWTEIDGGARFVIAIKSDGSLWTWGDSADGQLGDNQTTTDKSSPIQIGSLTDWAAFSAGSSHSHAIKTDGTLWGWGSDYAARMGNSTTNINVSSPVQIGLLTDWAKITVGSATSHAIKTDNKLWAWGYGNGGRLGNGLSGSASRRSSPVQIGSSSWSSVSTVTHSLAIRLDGTLWSWGLNANGGLGLGDVNGRSSPVQIGALSDWSFVHVASTMSLAIKTNGSLWAWGRNDFGSLGQGDTINRSSPVQVGNSTWTSVRGGSLQIIGLRTDGTLWGWGANNTGKLGLGDAGIGLSRSSPVQIGVSTNWTSTGAGDGNSFALHDEF